MSEEIIIKEVPIEEAVKVNATIVEFGAPYQKDYFENRYKDKEKLIIVAPINDQQQDILLVMINLDMFLSIFECLV